MSRQVLAGIVITASVIGSTFFFYFYQICFTANLRVQKTDKMLYIPNGANFTTVLDSLKQGDFLEDELSFAFLSKIVGYQDKVKPGAYLVQANCTNKDLIWRLKRGTQTPIKLTFNNLRLKQDLINLLDNKLQVEDIDLKAFLNNPDSCRLVGFDTTTIGAMFIPNTYEVYWNTSVPKLMRRFQTEYNKFWTSERKDKAAKLGLTPVEISILASIVEAETKKTDEMPIVARVYKNRLEQNMPLQADPTIVFALGDFAMKRVYQGSIKRAAASPYNTYLRTGLPPGPINFPSSTAIKQTLNMADNDYIFFCAKEDFSGYHNFAVSYEEHLKNVAKYTAALDKNNIK